MTLKTCQICGVDCSDRPRLRDGKGRYACKACVEAKSSRAKAGRSQTPRQAPADDDAALLAELVADAPITQPTPCPQCGTSMEPGNIICTNCGFNTSTGAAAAKTKVLKAEKAKKPKGPKGKGSSSGKDVDGVAIWQKRLIFTIVALILASIGFGVAVGMNMESFPRSDSGGLDLSATYEGGWLAARIAIWLGQVWALVCCIGMMRAFRWPIPAIIAVGLVLLVPCAGLIALLVMNGIATSSLKKAGWQVGFLGVK